MKVGHSSAVETDRGLAPGRVQVATPVHLAEAKEDGNAMLVMRELLAAKSAEVEALSAALSAALAVRGAPVAAAVVEQQVLSRPTRVQTAHLKVQARLWQLYAQQVQEQSQQQQVRRGCCSGRRGRSTSCASGRSLQRSASC